MKTEVIALAKEAERGAAEGARVLREGGLVAFPTETVYGLGANALNGRAVLGIFAAKGRPADNPLIVHVAHREALAEFACPDERAKALIETFWPGPLTLVLPKKDVVPNEVSAGLPTVGVRMPAHDGALALIRRAGLPVAAPSANTSGRPSPTCAQDVYEDMAGKIPLVLDGGPCLWGVESTVLSLAGEATVLRPGAVTPEEIGRVIGKVLVSPAALAPLKEGETAASPGMKYRHYAPKAEVILADGPTPEARAGVALRLAQNSPGRCRILATEETCGFYGGQDCVIMGSSKRPETLCAALFHCLRQADRDGVARVVLEALPPEALGLAYMNRALRAAGFRVALPTAGEF